MRRLLLIFLMILSLTACGVESQPPVPTNTLTTSNLPTSTSITAQTPIQIKTPWKSPTPIPTKTWPPTHTPSLTPIPPDPEIVEAQIVELFDTNGGCDLPCWWGIEAGVTSLEEVEKNIGPYAFDIYETQDTRTYLFRVPEYISFNEILGISFKYNILGIIEEIDPETIEWETSRFSLSRTLRLLGEPSEVWVIANKLFNPRFSIHLFYETAGMHLIYHGEAQVNPGKSVLVCPSKIFDSNNPTLRIWVAGKYASLADLDKSSSMDNIHMIDDITDLTLSEFYELYSNVSNTCFETPIEFAID